VSKDGGLL